MARQTKLGAALRPLDDAAPDATPTPEAPATQKAAPGPRTSPRKKSAASANGGSTTGSRKRAAAKATPATGPADDHDAADDRAPAQVLSVDTENAKRVSLYVHPDDYRALGMAKLDDGADLNSRLRAMIAVWRANARYRSQVDRLAKTAPRGGQP